MENESIKSKDTISEEESFGLKPLIYIRLSKNVKVTYPSFNLEKFYKLGNGHGFSLEVIPNLTFEKNNQLIEKTKDAWNELNENEEKFESQFKDEMLKTLDEALGNLVNSKEMKDINFEKDFQTKDLNSKNKDFKKLSDKVKKQKATMYWMLNKYFFEALPYCTSLTRGIPGSGFDLLSEMKNSLLSSVKLKFVNKLIEKLPTGSRGSATVKRHRAISFIDSGKCDHTGEFTIFGQLFQQYLKTDGPFGDQNFRLNNTDDQIF